MDKTPKPTEAQARAAVAQYIQVMFRNPHTIQDLVIGEPYFGIGPEYTMGGFG